MMINVDDDDMDDDDDNDGILKLEKITRDVEQSRVVLDRQGAPQDNLCQTPALR